MSDAFGEAPQGGWARRWPVHTGPREVWRRIGGTESGQREIFVQDPDGYLLMIAANIGTRIPAA